jgi:hypothetical protein
VPLGIDEHPAVAAQKVSSGSRPIVGPAARAFSITSSTSRGDARLSASVPPRSGAHARDRAHPNVITPTRWRIEAVLQPPAAGEQHHFTAK